MELSAVADELYSLRPDAFVGRRQSVAAEARAAGDKDLAATVQRLAKPTAAAWVVNMLVRHDPDQVEQVLTLGAALREAQSSMAGDDLRALGRQRRQLTAAVTRRARALAGDLGQKVGAPVATQVEETLHAAMVDEDAAAAVRTGLLVRPLAVTGLEGVDAAGAVALPSALGEQVVRRAPVGSARPDDERPGEERADSERPGLSVVPDHSRAIELAEDELAEAERVLADAEGKHAKAVRRTEKREAKGLQLRAELDELRRRTAELEQRIEDHEESLAEAEEIRADRSARVEAARAAVESARSALAAHVDRSRAP